MRRHRHDRARPVVHQDVVGDPDRDALAVHRVHDVVAGEDAVLLLRLALLDRPRARAFRVGAHLVVQPLDERMLGRQDEEGRAEQRVRPRREDRDVHVQLLVAEEHLRALGAADPVALDRLCLLGPVDQLQILEQLVRVGRDPEEPLLHVLRDDGRAAALALAVDHVLVGDDGLVLRAPVDGRLLPIREPGLEELQEQPLGPAVVLRLVRRDLPVPVDHPAQPAHLAADVRDVPLDDLPRMSALADRRVLGGQPERVPAHRAQDVPARSPAVMRDDVAQRVVEDVAHVQRPRGIREHLEHVELPLGLGPRARGRGRRRHARPPRPPATSSRLSPAGTCPCLSPSTKKPLTERGPWEAPRGSRRVRFLR